MTLPFKYLPHEILNKPKPALAIRVYLAASRVFHPQANREASDASQTGDHHLCPPLITEPTTHKPPEKEKEKKTHAETHRQRRPTTTEIDPPAAETHRLALRRRQHHLHLQPPPLRTSTTTDTKTQVIVLPLLYDSNRRCLHRPCAATAVDPHSRRSQAPRPSPSLFSI